MTDLSKTFFWRANTISRCKQFYIKVEVWISFPNWKVQNGTSIKAAAINYQLQNYVKSKLQFLRKM